jgi:hypothetical protein
MRVGSTARRTYRAAFSFREATPEPREWRDEFLLRVSRYATKIDCAFSPRAGSLSQNAGRDGDCPPTGVRDMKASRFRGTEKKRRSGRIRATRKEIASGGQPAPDLSP